MSDHSSTSCSQATVEASAGTIVATRRMCASSGAPSSSYSPTCSRSASARASLASIVVRMVPQRSPAAQVARTTLARGACTRRAGCGPLGSAELRRGPRRGQARVQLVRERGDRDPLLGQRVAVAERDGVVLERLVVDGDAVGRADLVLPAVALADRAALVVLAL